MTYLVEVENDETGSFETFMQGAANLKAAIKETTKPNNPAVVIRIYGQTHTAAITSANVIVTNNTTGVGFYL